MLPQHNLTECLHFIKLKYYYHEGPWLMGPILEKNKASVVPHAPKSRVGKWCVLALHGYIFDLGGMGDLLFHFIQSKIVLV